MDYLQYSDNESDVSMTSEKEPSNRSEVSSEKEKPD
jgi:hypothetical protein